MLREEVAVAVWSSQCSDETMAEHEIFLTLQQKFRFDVRDSDHDDVTHDRLITFGSQEDADEFVALVAPLNDLMCGPNPVCVEIGDEPTIEEPHVWIPFRMLHLVARYLPAAFAVGVRRHHLCDGGEAEVPS